jgi:hypothetical protein
MAVVARRVARAGPVAHAALDADAADLIVEALN